MAYKWDSKRARSRVKSKPQLIYEIICALLVLAAIIYSLATGTAPENTGF